jgi:hypothetical protein
LRSRVTRLFHSRTQAFNAREADKICNIFPVDLRYKLGPVMNRRRGMDIFQHQKDGSWKIIRYLAYTSPE